MNSRGSLSFELQLTRPPQVPIVRASTSPIHSMARRNAGAPPQRAGLWQAASWQLNSWSVRRSRKTLLQAGDLACQYSLSLS
jgi:hypothetical protein